MFTVQIGVRAALKICGCLARFALPRVTDYRPLYQFLRMGPPCVLPMIGVFVSMYTVSFPRDGVQFLFAGHLTVWPGS